MMAVNHSKLYQVSGHIYLSDFVLKNIFNFFFFFFHLFFCYFNFTSSFYPDYFINYTLGISS